MRAWDTLAEVNDAASLSQRKSGFLGEMLFVSAVVR